MEEHTGPVLAVRAIPDGLNCAIAACLTSAEGRTFVKGVRTQCTKAHAAQRWEVAVNPHVRTVGPRLLWQVTAEGWDLLGFEYIDGRHADLSRGSPDLPLVAEALHAAQDLGVPYVLGVPWFADRWAPYLDATELALLGGETLLHTDTNPHNLLVAHDRAHLVDWAMPALGPAWVDVACTAVRLMEADCAADEALSWAARFPSWRAADPTALRAFVTANRRQWESRVGRAAARHSNARFAALLRG
ncbi:phosphotransferase [Streptomyces sp. C36]|uniref:phosphotransferase n=1 Tax=Streptomyces sp. C36 TaxID=3237122 RepID=UPI0034C6AC5A